jgi:hypothetical protein
MHGKTIKKININMDHRGNDHRQEKTEVLGENLALIILCLAKFPYGLP